MQAVVILILILVVVAFGYYILYGSGKKIGQTASCETVRDGTCIGGAEQCPQGYIASGFSCEENKRCCTPIGGGI